MTRAGRVQLGVYQGRLDPPPSRRAVNVALTIVVAVAALSFTIGLMR